MGAQMAIDHIEHRVETRPCFGEFEIGDGTVLVELKTGWFIAIIDVLGHGSEAAQLARAMECFLSQRAGQNIRSIMQDLHAEFIGSRGAAVLLAFISREDATLRYTGVGNARLLLVGKSVSHHEGQPGIVGLELPHLREEQTSLNQDEVWAFMTDGIAEHGSDEELQEHRLQRLESITASLFHRFAKLHDDATCILIRVVMS